MDPRPGWVLLRVLTCPSTVRYRYFCAYPDPSRPQDRSTLCRPVESLHHRHRHHACMHDIEIMSISQQK